MFVLVKARLAYDCFSKSLWEFLNRYDFLEDGELNIPKKELNDISKVVARQILDRFNNMVIVNDTKWHHFQDEKLPWTSILNIFLSALRTRPNYVSKRFDQFPHKVYDIETDDLDGELKEELIKNEFVQKSLVKDNRPKKLL